MGNVTRLWYSLVGLSGILLQIWVWDVICYYRYGGEMWYVTTDMDVRCHMLLQIWVWDVICYYRYGSVMRCDMLLQIWVWDVICYYRYGCEMWYATTDMVVRCDMLLQIWRVWDVMWYVTTDMEGVRCNNVTRDSWSHLFISVDGRRCIQRSIASWTGCWRSH